MAISVEAAKRELSGALIDIFKFKAAQLLPKVESCKTLLELREVIFVILDDMRAAEPEKAKRLLVAWESLNGESH